MRVALVGNQNCGKTSLFNKLTGSNQKVGNWPGVTIEKKEGIVSGTNVEVIDLPGVYSLLPYTSEEDITREYLLKSPPDVVINVIDATMLERSLYLTSQLIDLEIPVIIALNMVDVLEKRNWKLDEKLLSKSLGVDALKVSARTGQGMSELVSLIQKQKTQNRSSCAEKYSKMIENSIKKIKNEPKIKNNLMAIEYLMGEQGGEFENFSREREVFNKLYGGDFEHEIAAQRFKFAADLDKKCLVKVGVEDVVSDKLDRIFLNKFLAIPIFVLIMSLMYFLSVGVVGRITLDFINRSSEIFLQKASLFLSGLGVSGWLVSLLVNGIFTGVFSVLSFLPQLIVIFLFINLLETTGYMSRVAFMFDRIFYKLGLSGKSLIPFIIGSGCSVPAISSTRAIEKQSEKEKSIILSPFIPCSAKLPIISLFAGYFFPKHSGLVVASLYFLAIFLIIISALIFNFLFFRKKENSFISELPEYRLPSLKYTVKDVFEKAKEFVFRAGTIIVLCSLLIWFLGSFSPNLRFCENIETSILAYIGKLFAWFFYPIIGELNWAASVSAIQGLVAKEQVVSSMSIISGLAEGELVGSIFSKGIFSSFNKLSAYSFVVFNLFSAPCLASIAAMKSELKSVKKTIFAVCFQIGLAWIVSSLIYQVGGLFF